jgi:hypothetical protein
MWLQLQDLDMSADQQYPMGMRHMTVVPENFEPFDVPDVEDAADEDDAAE